MARRKCWCTTWTERWRTASPGRSCAQATSRRRSAGSGASPSRATGKRKACHFALESKIYNYNYTTVFVGFRTKRICNMSIPRFLISFCCPETDKNVTIFF
ncbi:hypothetical protein VPH35_071972 [Triticum aestivum]